ncbi:MAG: hypothetical protein LKF61_06210 [Eggerthellaceae bacterium]|jgi:hypothetical protein|nr:hypothetical protein [Eggerthellaceae bacterium]MCH4220702.1 hypothetical protein [Eggerthellaceae bacterium]
MKTYSAHYQSPRDAHPVNGTFDFQSDFKAGSKKNMTDARIKMLELFGNKAVSWQINDVVSAGSHVAEDTDDVQLQLDFREPRKIRKHHTFDRGRV